eukprot:scaffold6251_cov82-Cylindrotheca_fusiformis.AAC.2
MDWLYDGSTLEQVGKVRVHYWEPNGTDGNWKQLGTTLVGDDDYDNLGSSVDLSDDGETLAVGASGGNYSKVFQWNGDWQRIGDALTEGDGGGFFGSSFSTLVGAIWANKETDDGSTLEQVGKVRVYTVGNQMERMGTGNFFLRTSEILLASNHGNPNCGV